MKLRYTPAAICDLEEIEAYIRDTLQNPDAAMSTITSIANSCALLKDQPQMGGELSKKLNREIEERFIICGKHMVIYDIDEAASIIRVLDTRTDYLTIILSELMSG